MHPTSRVSGTKEAEVVALKLKHVCDSCARTFPTLRRIPVLRWCEGGLTQRSRRGFEADRVVKVVKKRAAEALLDQVYVGNYCPQEHALFRVFGGAKLQCDGSDGTDVLHSHRSEHGGWLATLLAADNSKYLLVLAAWMFWYVFPVECVC